jgi:holo-[acyl-carrier protein] synthase
MILGVGIDLTASEPWREALQDPSGAAVEACFTPGERAAAAAGPVPPAERLAARWAAKEAFLKALGAAPRRLDPREIEVLAEAGGVPTLRLHGAARAAAGARGVRRTWLSLTHDGAFAAAVVVIEG